MKKISENRYYDVLKRAYFDERMEKAQSQYYKDWINGKFKHSIEVTEVGIEILNNTPQLSELSDEVKEEFVSALLTHDLARAKEIDHITGKVTGIDHSTLGAIDLVKEGETSLNVIIPVMVHSRFDDRFIEAGDEELKVRKDFAKLCDEDKSFVMEMRSRFFALSDEEKRIIKLGVGLVKDADKVANLLHCMEWIPLEEKIMPHQDVYNPYISKEAMDDMLVRGEKMVAHASVKTMCDKIIFWMSWVNDLRFEASKDIVRKNNLLQNMKKTMMDILKDEDEKDLAKLSDDFDLIIGYLV